MTENKDSTAEALRIWSCPDPKCPFRTYGYDENEIHNLAQDHVTSVHCGGEEPSGFPLARMHGS